MGIIRFRSHNHTLRTVANSLALERQSVNHACVTVAGEGSENSEIEMMFMVMVVNYCVLGKSWA